MKFLIAIAFLLMSSFLASAQTQPQPDNKTPQDQQMPNYMPEDLPADIPNMEFLSGHGTNLRTGEPSYYMDTESGLYFDFREKIVRDFKAGKEYTFEELEKLLRKKRDAPQELKKSVSDHSAFTLPRLILVFFY